MATVSVCIPVWNGAAFVAATVRSVLEQTWEDLEVVAVDDHSTDGSYELLRSIDDPRLRVVRNETRAGAAGAWNRAMAEARGRYVKLLCHDDTLLPGCLEAQVAALDGDPGAALVAGRRHITDADGRILLADRGLAGLDPGPVRRSEALRATVRAGTNLFGEPACVLMRADAVARAGGFDGTLPYVIDLDYWCRLLQAGHLIALPETVATFRVTAGSWSVALASAQTRQIVALFRRLRHEPGSGVTTADVALGAARAAALQSGRSALYRLLRYRAPAERVAA